MRLASLHFASIDHSRYAERPKNAITNFYISVSTSVMKFRPLLVATLLTALIPCATKARYGLIRIAHAKWRNCAPCIVRIYVNNLHVPVL